MTEGCKTTVGPVRPLIAPAVLSKSLNLLVYSSVK